MKKMEAVTESAFSSTDSRHSGERNAITMKRASLLAERIERGAEALGSFAEGLSESDWRAVVPVDGRTVGVTVHHVASMYPLEIKLVQELASGRPIQGVTWAAVASINAEHARDHASVTKAETLALLRKNSEAAAEAVRALTDEELDRAGNVSLNADAPLTSQFFIEDHPLRHSWHHLARIRAALQK